MTDDGNSLMLQSGHTLGIDIIGYTNKENTKRIYNFLRAHHGRRRPINIIRITNGKKKGIYIWETLNIWTCADSITKTKEN